MDLRRPGRPCLLPGAGEEDLPGLLALLGRAEAEAADNTLEPESGAQVTSFRFCLSGGSSFEMAYISHEGKTGELKGKNINYQTTEDVSRLWDGFSDEEETPASVSELPAI